MRALYLEVPEHVLEDRHRWGADRHDEVWDGVLHMVPQPTTTHNLHQLDLVDALRPIADRLGLRIFTEGALFDPVAGEKNYRVPDLTFARDEQISERGLEGAELVIEVLSPNDESRAKLPMFARTMVREVWFTDPHTRAIELLELSEGTYIRVLPVDDVMRSRVLGIDLRVVAGPRLEIRDGATVTLV